MIAWSREAVASSSSSPTTQGSTNPSAASSRTASAWCAPTARSTSTTAACAPPTDGATLFDHADYQRYYELIHEEVKPWSYMKFPFIVEQGTEAGWYRVGPLARVAQCDFIPTELAEARAPRLQGLRRRRGAVGAARLPLGAHDRDAACGRGHQGAAARQRPLRRRPDRARRAPAARRRRHRGAARHADPPLPHQRGRPDRQRQPDRLHHPQQPGDERGGAPGGQAIPRRPQLTEGLLNHIEVAIRAFDPCLSCATHALGKMPLENRPPAGCWRYVPCVWNLAKACARKRRTIFMPGCWRP
jgi:NAD-reducing hydrogenase large subunit